MEVDEENETVRIDYGRTEHKAMANDRPQWGDWAWVGTQNLDFPANQWKSKGSCRSSSLAISNCSATL